MTTTGLTGRERYQAEYNCPKTAHSYVGGRFWELARTGKGIQIVGGYLVHLKIVDVVILMLATDYPKSLQEQMKHLHEDSLTTAVRRMDDQSLRLKMFLERLGNTFLMCDERGIRNCVYAPTMSRSRVRFPSELLYADSDDSHDSDDDASEVVSENEGEGAAESEDHQANAIDGVGHDRRAEEAEAEEIIWNGADDEWGNEAAGPQLGAESFDGTGERSGAGGDKDGKEQCILSVHFENCSLSAMNPFEAYGQYDGTSQSGAETSTFRVFLSMLPPSEQNPPLRVCVVKSATFSDLIGLALFKYASENPNWSVRLKDDVSEYGMCIAGEEGEVGSEPHVLDSREKIGDFTHVNLAVVESPVKDMELKELEEEDGPICAGDCAELYD